MNLLGSREELSHLAIKHVADIVWIADLDNRLVYVSPSITKILGYTIEEAMNHSMEDVFTPKSVEVMKNILMEEYVEKKKRQQTFYESRVFEVDMYHINGSIVPVEINASFVNDSNGQPIGFLSVARDISKLKQADRKIERLYNQEKKLRESLEAEIRKRSDFARVLVHELKTPLTSIYTLAGLLRESNQEPPYDRVTNNIFRSASELNERIGELLELTRVEVGELQIKPRRINPSVMTSEIIKDIEPIVSKSKLQLRMQIPSKLPFVNADRRRIRQVMQNLVDNAIKATTEGGEIIIKVIEKGAFLIMQVQDTGQGMRRKDLIHVFEAYYRVKGIAEGNEGLGLGLTLSKGIVESHGGQIWVESKLGKGSTFSFSIPLSKS
ncbi:ATP-binding protein [Chloroflexota bacterium]